MLLTLETRTGEEQTTCGFVAIIIYLFVDISIGIYRIFTKKQGLYFWSMLIETWGCLIGAIGIILSYLYPNGDPIWAVHTLFLLLGWTIFCPAQLHVLYSRLHLVNKNRSFQRSMLIMIIVVSLLMIIPVWPLDWLSKDPYKPHQSAVYSPRKALTDRYTQVGYTIAECTLSGSYIWSLTRLLSLKSNVRQRRVMTDLIYVNIIAIALDIVTVLLIFLNQVGFSFAVQATSYIVKFKLEFIVLNQLMAVAARGLQKDTFAERRYHHHPSTLSEKYQYPRGGSESSRWGLNSAREQQRSDSVKELVIPSPTPSKANGTSNDTTSQSKGIFTDRGTVPVKAKFKKHGGELADGNSKEDKDEEEEIGIHMWENRGKLVMEVPWFKRQVQA